MASHKPSRHKPSHHNQLVSATNLFFGFHKKEMEKEGQWNKKRRWFKRRRKRKRRRLHKTLYIYIYTSPFPIYPCTCKNLQDCHTLISFIKLNRKCLYNLTHSYHTTDNHISPPISWPNFDFSTIFNLHKFYLIFVFHNTYNISTI